jgi:hypothetical protein
MFEAGISPKFFGDSPNVRASDRAIERLPVRNDEMGEAPA